MRWSDQSFSQGDKGPIKIRTINLIGDHYKLLQSWWKKKKIPVALILEKIFFYDSTAYSAFKNEKNQLIKTLTKDVSYT